MPGILQNWNFPIISLIKSVFGGRLVRGIVEPYVTWNMVLVKSTGNPPNLRTKTITIDKDSQIWGGEFSGHMQITEEVDLLIRSESQEQHIQTKETIYMTDYRIGVDEKIKQGFASGTWTGHIRARLDRIITDHEEWDEIQRTQIPKPPPPLKLY